MEDKKNVLDLAKIWGTLYARKKTFIKVWIWTFVLSCIWIFPQPRYYTSEISVAPESADMGAGGSLSSLASSFGIDIGGFASADAIYPLVYPDLFESPEFIVSLWDIVVTTKDGEVKTDLYTYYDKYQEENWLTYPFIFLKNKISKLFTSEEEDVVGTGGSRFNPFMMSRKQTKILDKTMKNISCTHDKKTDVVSLSVTDQDPLVCALLVDSITNHLQDFIINYRTKKSRVDLEHYTKLVADAKVEYDNARHEYCLYADSHVDTKQTTYRMKLEDLENEMQIKYNIYTTLITRLEAARAKVQEITPVFTVLKSPMVPVLPAGPKRVLFVLSMLVLCTMVTIGVILRRAIANYI